MNIQDMLLTSKKARPRTKRSKTTKVAWHWVGNAGSSAAANRNYFNNSGVYASSHYIIGLDGEIIRCVPEDEVAYTTNSANSYSIGIECCHPTSDGHYNEATYNSMIELGAYLCKKYNLDPINDMIRHYDVTKKCCPKWFVEHPSDWVKFKNDIKNKMNGNGSILSSVNVPYIARITCDELNIREKDSFDSKVVGVLHKGDAYTITQESNGLGKLKYEGWISVNEKYIDKLPVQQTQEPNSFRIKVINCDTLNARTGAGTNYPIADVVKKGTILTIVGESGNWYKTKSSLYVHKSYCEKI